MVKVNSGGKARLYFLVVILVVILGLAWFAYSTFATSTIAAEVRLNEGAVKVNGERILDPQELNVEDVIETDSTGSATVILYGSVVVELENNTKVTIRDLTQKHPKLEQEKGSTWNTFTKISGVEEYTINQGNNVASVRGTSFGFSEGKLITAEGLVKFVIDGKEFLVEPKKVVERIGDKIIFREAVPTEIEKMKEFMLSAISELKDLRDREIREHQGFVDVAVPIIVSDLIENQETETQESLTQDQIDKFFEEADLGLYDVDEIIGYIPFEFEFIQRIADITKEIQDLNRKMAELG